MGRALDFAASFEESGPATPIFFILSPGVDPLKDVENQGEKNLPRTKAAPSHSLLLLASVSFSIPYSRLITQYSIFANHTEIRVTAKSIPWDCCCGLCQVESTVAGFWGDFVWPPTHSPYCGWSNHSEDTSTLLAQARCPQDAVQTP